LEVFTLESKECHGCSRNLPATSEYFHKDKKGRLGFSSRCRECKGSKFKKIARDGFKVCNFCEEELPFNAEYFYFKNSRGTCKKCTLVKQKEYTDRNREEVLKRKKDYRDRTKENMKKYREENKERISAVAKIYYENNRDRINELHKIYIEEHREELREKRREYMRSEKGREVFRILNQKRRNLKKNTIVNLTKEDWESSLEFFDYKDAYTGLEMEKVSQDHVIPISKGGHHTKRNIVPCDQRINSSKWNHDIEEWYKKQEFYNEERLQKIYEWIGYNPKTQTQRIAQ
jgi:5-methylcytosine-specific restriction endonuclease McrA